MRCGMFRLDRNLDPCGSTEDVRLILMGVAQTPLCCCRVCRYHLEEQSILWIYHRPQLPG